MVEPLRVFDHVGFFRFRCGSLVRLMRGLYERIPDTELPVLGLLGLILACLAPGLFIVAALGFFLTRLDPLALALVLVPPLALVLAPLVLASQSWSGRCWPWLCRPYWFLGPWSWLYRCWLTWPLLCWSWLR